MLSTKLRQQWTGSVLLNVPGKLPSWSPFVVSQASSVIRNLKGQGKTSPCVLYGILEYKWAAYSAAHGMRFFCKINLVEYTDKSLKFAMGKVQPHQHPLEN